MFSPPLNRNNPVGVRRASQSGHLRGSTPVRPPLISFGEAILPLSRSDAWAIARLDAHAQAAMVRGGIVPIGALVEAAIQRIEDIDPALNSVTHRAFDHARTAVDRVDRAAPMAAVPALLKASLAYPGFPQTSCSRAKQHVIATKAWPICRTDGCGRPDRSRHVGHARVRPAGKRRSATGPDRRSTPGTRPILPADRAPALRSRSPPDWCRLRMPATPQAPSAYQPPIAASSASNRAEAGTYAPENII